LCSIAALSVIAEVGSIFTRQENAVSYDLRAKGRRHRLHLDEIDGTME